MLDDAVLNQKVNHQSNFSKDDPKEWVSFLRWLGINVEEPSGRDKIDE